MPSDSRPRGSRRPLAAALVVMLSATLALATLAIPALATAVATAPRPGSSASGTPDYANPAHWLSADTTGTLPVDVFYLYPTSYVATNPAEPVVCAIDDPGMVAGAKIAHGRQATIFEPVEAMSLLRTTGRRTQATAPR